MRLVTASLRGAVSRLERRGQRPGQEPYEGTARRAHASYETLRRLEGRLDELARGLHSADGRFMARVLCDALREEVGG